MPVKLKLAPRPKRPATLGASLLRAVLVLGLMGLLVFAGIVGFFYLKYQKVVDQRLAAGPLFANAAQIYAAPREVRNAQRLSAAAIARAMKITSGSLMPPSAQSQADSRTLKGFFSGHAARTARNTCRGYLTRFSTDPPYSSPRALVRGDRKLASK